MTRNSQVAAVSGDRRKRNAVSDIGRWYSQEGDAMTQFVQISDQPAISPTGDADLMSDSGIRDRVFAISPRFVAFVSIGPLAPGHTLVCPRFSCECIGDVISHASILTELDSFLKHVEGLLLDVFGGEMVRFEHGGSSGSRPIGSSPIHAHLHLLPGVSHDELRSMFTSEDAIVRNGEFSWERVSGLWSVVFPASARQEYLFLGSNADSWCARVRIDDVVPHQYLRQRVGQAVGNSSWDWREFPRIDEVQCSLDNLSTYIASRQTERVQLPPAVFGPLYTASVAD